MSANTLRFPDRERSFAPLRFNVDRFYRNEKPTVQQPGHVRQRRSITAGVETELRNRTAEGIGVGGAIGGLAGGFIGALVTVFTAIVVPGLGLIVAGPLAGGLIGAGAGALTGGTLGALVGHTMVEERVMRYHEGTR